jgi:hypothetical protein
MSVNIEAASLSMPQSLDSLKTTPLTMHKLYFELTSVDTWYAIMREARAQFGKNWRSQSHVKRRLERYGHLYNAPSSAERVWFEVPDPKFGTWVAIKHAVRQVTPPGK